MAGRQPPADGQGPTEQSRVYVAITAMTSPRPQGELTVERICMLAAVCRAGYYRGWQAPAPRQEETAFAT